MLDQLPHGYTPAFLIAFIGLVAFAYAIALFFGK